MGRALSGLLGNDALKKDLSLALAAGRLAHSVLLCGEQGMGAGFAARCLAADFLYPQGGAAAAAVLEGRSPEVLTLAGEGASGFIKIDAVRAVRRAIYDTSLSAAGRVVLVYGAEKLNAASANAMLKVIEEPPENVLFVFTAVSEAAVLPTIRSRCSVYTLAPLAVPECAAALERLGAKPQQARRLAEIFDGRLGEAKACLADEKRSPGPSGLCWPVKKRMPMRPFACWPRTKRTGPAQRHCCALCAMCAPAHWQSGPAARFPRPGPRAVRRARARPCAC